MNARAKQLTPEHSEPLEESTLAPIFRMSKSQLLVSWSIVGMMLIVVFLFGFYSGRKQGVELALTEQSVPRLRLPVENPKARAALSTTPQVTEITPPTTKFDFTDSKPDSFALDNHEKVDSHPVISEPKNDPTAGFVGKAANEITVHPVEPPTEPVAKSEITEQSLADRVANVELSPTLGTAAIKENPVKAEKPEIKNQETIKAPVQNIAPPVAPKSNISKESKIVPPPPVKKAAIVPVVKAAPVPATGLFVQVGAPDSFIKAQTIVSKLKTKGITAAIRDASVNNKMHYRVLVGPFGSRDNAQNAKNQVIKSGAALGEPFIKNY